MKLAHRQATSLTKMHCSFAHWLLNILELRYKRYLLLIVELQGSNIIPSLSELALLHTLRYIPEQILENIQRNKIFVLYHLFRSKFVFHFIE